MAAGGQSSDAALDTLVDRTEAYWRHLGIVPANGTEALGGPPVNGPHAGPKDASGQAQVVAVLGEPADDPAERAAYHHLVHELQQFCGVRSDRSRGLQ